MSLLPTDLFDLVHSLSKAEKAHIRKTSGDTGQGYMQLLADLEKAKAYDEKEFVKKHAHRPYVKNYRFSKHYLYQYILEALQGMNHSAQASPKVFGAIHKADILFARALHQQAFSLLEKTAALCEEKELFAPAIECYSRQYRIIYKGGHNIGKPEVSRAVCQKQIAAAEKLLQYLRVTEWQNNLMVLLRSKGNDAKKHALEVEQTMAQVQLLNPGEDAPIKSQVQWLNTMATGCFATHNHIGALQYQQQLVAIYEQNAKWAKEEPYNHLSAINNLALLLLELDRIDEVETALALFEPYLHLLQEPKPPHTAIKAAESGYNLWLRYGIAHDRLPMGFVSEKIKPFLATFGKQIAPNQKINFYLHMAFYHCLQGEYAQAHEALMPILHEIPKDIRTDLHLQARMVELIIHYQLGNQDLLPYLMDAVYRKAQGKYKEMAELMRAYFGSYLGTKTAAREKLHKAMDNYQAQYNNRPYLIEKVVMAWAKKV